MTHATHLADNSQTIEPLVTAVSCMLVGLRSPGLKAVSTSKIFSHLMVNKRGYSIEGDYSQTKLY